MALDIDTSQALRRPGDLVALVRAIDNASPADEPDWLEWKSELDLTAAAGRFAVTRAILGLANRVPARAAKHCTGLGYVVVGAEPGAVRGTAVIDPAELDDGFTPYLGGVKGPQWNPTYVSIDGVEVLVIIVEAPSNGDPIFTLRRQFEKARAGTILVRHPGKTTPATDADLDALQERLMSARSADDFALNVRLIGALPLRWFDSRTFDAGVEAWTSSHRSNLMRGAEKVERRRTGAIARDPDVASLGFAAADVVSHLAAQAARMQGMWSSVSPLAPEPDTRTLEEYASQLDDWVVSLREAAPAIMYGEFFAERNRVRIQVENPTSRNLGDVQVKVNIPGEFVKAFQDEPNIEPLPSPPRKFGEPTPRVDPNFLNIARLASPHVEPLDYGLPSRLRLDDGSIIATFDAGRLRPEEVDETEDDIFVMLTEPPPDGLLRGTWTATSVSVDAVLRGEFTVPVDETPITALQVLTAADERRAATPRDDRR